MTQSQALEIMKTGTNVFLTGEPGAGKTHTVNAYVAWLRAHGIEPAITASTGIAATHISGMTIHSWSGIGIRKNLDRQTLSQIASAKHIAKRIESTNVLIIDEVSRLPPEVLTMVDAVCRAVRQNTDPFGGIQAVLVGDFFQLPPVVKAELAEGGMQAVLMERPSARFAFDSPVWEQARPVVCYLTEQHRQDDSDFLALLSAIRCNEFNDDHLSRLETRKIARGAIPPGAPKLFSHNLDVDRVNDEILARLPGDPRVFTMFSQGPAGLVQALKKSCLSPETLRLKTGAAVMFTKNNPQSGFVNGTLGTVEKFDAGTGYPVIKTRSGRTVMLEPLEWAVEEDAKVRAKISQLPLRLAWAITVHKSQGMSLDEAVMDLGNVFEFGQGYVALSRVRRLSGLYLLGWNERAFQVHPEVLERDAEFRERSEQAAAEQDAMAGDEARSVQGQFILACGGSVAAKDPEEVPRTAIGPGTAVRGPRWEETLALIKSGKTVAEVAKLRARTEGTVIGHLETVQELAKLPPENITHLGQGMEQAIVAIQAAFRELRTDKLAPVFHQFNGAYSYETLRMARLMMGGEAARDIPAADLLNYVFVEFK